MSTTPIRLAATSRQRLLDAADANLVLHKGWIAERIAGMEVVAADGLTLVDTGLPLENFNVALRARLDTAEAERRIAAVVERFRGAGLPFTWWVGDHDRPPGLAEHLRAAGLRAEDVPAVMALELDGDGPWLDGADTDPPELRVEVVRDETALRHFAEVTAATWTPGDDTVLRYYAAGAPALLAPGAALRLYVGYAESEPVATAELAVGPDLVGIYNIATHPSHQRRGYGSTLTRRPLLDARAEGFHTAVLQATPEGERIYRRLGFRTVGRYTVFGGPTGSPNHS